jgi:hypothetical protein
MKALTAEDLLYAWEIARSQNLASWAIHILALICPQEDPERLARLSIGQRDALLLDLRESTFGSQMVSVASCPICGEKNELIFDVSDIRVGHEGSLSEIHEIKIRDCEIQFRLPASEDLLGLQSASDGRSTLLRRCILIVRDNGREVPLEELDEEIAIAVAQEMSRTDPQADIQLALSCVSCGHKWLMIFDIVSFLQGEMDFWAGRILHEVHALASVYGWREADILSMSHMRRQLYMELVG